MSPPWEPQVLVPPDLARRLVEQQFPELAPFRPVLVGSGWDNIVYRAGTLAFRFPRRDLGAELLEQEMRWMPVLAPQLPAAVPVVRYRGRSTTEYPYSFAGCDWVDGRTACAIDPLPDAHRLAADLGTFLAELHRQPVPPDAPADAMRKADLQRVQGMITERLPKLQATGFSLPKNVQEQSQHLAQTPAGKTGPCWVHGDLYGRHVVLKGGQLAGVIDWGDLHAGDAALDLSVAWTLLPPALHDVFCSTYGGVEEATWRRAQFRALFYGVSLGWYGTEIGDADMVRLGRRALQHACAAQD